MRELLKNIFSITDYGETHHILRLCGIKLKFPKREYAVKIKESPVFYYKKNNIDITTIPPAEGQLRDIQLANLALLNELDYVCKTNKIDYWLDYGSTLGAVRHKGYIPWDDDIDVGMIREDYEKFIDIFNSSTRNSCLYADFSRNRAGSVIIKIKHRKSDYVCVDIFPFDFCSKDVVGDNPIKTTLTIKKMCKKIQKKYKNSSITELREVYKNYRESLLSESESNDKSFVMRGVDFCGFPSNWFYKCETIFPITGINFEGAKYSCLNDTDSFLKSLYGDYMSYPKKIGVGHTALLTLNDEERTKIKEIIDKE